MKNFIAILILLAIGLCGLYLANAGKSKLVITKNGEIISYANGVEINLDVDNEFVVEGENGYNKIKIEDGKVQVVEADCPDKVCVDCGIISKDSLNKVIACVPHRLIVEIR